ncbi:unnamed protein product, partial [Mesorhabditis belari]|uniref:Uncharacterized protein n=1 Tax=Mesorhabditis belari TaxID=2138241 RepID=A0AAF3EDV2_9BILA
MLLTIMTTPENGDCAEDTGLEESNMSAWGMFLTTYSDYWEFTECSRLLDAVLDIHDVALRKLVAEMQGDARLAIRGLFLDMQYSDQAASAFWLAAVFNKLTTPEYRPKFFMLLFLDPVEANGKRTLDWRRMVTEANANHYAECLNAGLYQNVQCELLAQEKIRVILYRLSLKA